MRKLMKVILMASVCLAMVIVMGSWEVARAGTLSEDLGFSRVIATGSTCVRYGPGDFRWKSISLELDARDSSAIFIEADGAQHARYMEKYNGQPYRYHSQVTLNGLGYASHRLVYWSTGEIYRVDIHLLQGAGTLRIVEPDSWVLEIPNITVSVMLSKEGIITGINVQGWEVTGPRHQNITIRTTEGLVLQLAE